MTVVIEFPPGDPGTTPHRHSGPCFGYVLDGEMVFELEGERARVVRAWALVELAEIGVCSRKREVASDALLRLAARCAREGGCSHDA